MNLQSSLIWYGVFGFIGAVIGAVIAGALVASLYNDFSCYGTDGFGNVFFICEDPSTIFIVGGLLLGLAAAYFIRRSRQRT